MYHIFFQWKYLTLCLFYEKIELIDFLIEGAEVSDFPIKEQNFQYFILKVLKKKNIKIIYFVLFWKQGDSLESLIWNSKSLVHSKFGLSNRKIWKFDHFNKKKLIVWYL